MSTEDSAQPIPSVTSRHSLDCANTCLRVIHSLATGMQGYSTGKIVHYHWDLEYLYRTLRNSWRPILECWPNLYELDQQKTWNDWEIDWTHPDPASIWVLLRNCFWRIVAHTGYWGQACLAWTTMPHDLTPIAGEQSFFAVPLPYEGLEDVRFRFTDMMRSGFINPESWERVYDKLASTPPAESQAIGAIPFHLMPTPNHCPATPLPETEGALRKLLLDVENAIDYYSSRAAVFGKLRPTGILSRPWLHVKSRQLAKQVEPVNWLEAHRCVSPIRIGALRYKISRWKADVIDPSRLTGIRMLKRSPVPIPEEPVAYEPEPSLTSQFNDEVSQSYLEIANLFCDLRRTIETTLISNENCVAEAIQEDRACGENASIESITLDLIGQDWIVKAHRNGADRSLISDEFPIPGGYTKLITCFVVNILGGGASGLVKWHKLNGALLSSCEGSAASDEVRKAIHNLRTLFRENLGTPPGEDDGEWFITKKGDGVRLNRCVEWKVTPEATKFLSKRSPRAGTTDPQKMAAKTKSTGPSPQEAADLDD